ncbi:MAG: hypothetical protein K0S07_880 [Chlamydiales bacterium]|jgi:bifunctional DNase/RNase|nr:hypothetical protein [Chlamydiales bacterium]
MHSELIQLSFDKIMQTRSYTMIVLKAPSKRFAIYTDPLIGRILHLFLTDTENPRPLTHDLLFRIFQGYDIRVKQVVINDVQDTVYFARLFLEKTLGPLRHILELDGRPSDCITFALMGNAPVFCTADVLEKAIALEE